MGRKIARGFGTAVCVLLFVMCVFMIIVSAVFGSEGLVGAFGYNLYLCEESAFDGVQSGSAVVVEQCEPYDLTVGMLILYTSGEAENLVQSLGYTETVAHRDGVYSITVSDSSGKHILISEGDFVGRAGWSSPALGRIISFSLTPWGILVMAVMPCFALILYSVVKAVADERPLPEVMPQVKNAEREEPKPTPGLSVKSDGNASYSRSSNKKPPTSADSVLFTYGTKNGKSPAVMRKDSPVQNRPASSAAQKPPAKPVAEAQKPSAASRPSDGGVPSSVAARNYLDSATAARTPQQSPVKTRDVTAEIPQPVKKKKNDAFFTQSSAPQIGKQRSNPKNRAVIDLEDALATVGERQNARKPSDASSKRSADIIASKRRDELMAEEEDQRDKSRYDVDDILAGLDRRRKS